MIACQQQSPQQAFFEHHRMVLSPLSGLVLQPGREGQQQHRTDDSSSTADSTGRNGDDNECGNKKSYHHGVPVLKSFFNLLLEKRGVEHLVLVQDNAAIAAVARKRKRRPSESTSRRRATKKGPSRRRRGSGTSGNHRSVMPLPSAAPKHDTGAPSNRGSSAYQHDGISTGAAPNSAVSCDPPLIPLRKLSDHRPRAVSAPSVMMAGSLPSSTSQSYNKSDSKKDTATRGMMSAWLDQHKSNSTGKLLDSSSLSSHSTVTSGSSFSYYSSDSGNSVVVSTKQGGASEVVRPLFDYQKSNSTGKLATRFNDHYHENSRMRSSTEQQGRRGGGTSGSSISNKNPALTTTTTAKEQQHQDPPRCPSRRRSIDESEWLASMGPDHGPGDHAMMNQPKPAPRRRLKGQRGPSSRRGSGSGNGGTGRPRSPPAVVTSGGTNTVTPLNEQHVQDGFKKVKISHQGNDGTASGLVAVGPSRNSETGMATTVGISNLLAETTEFKPFSLSAVIKMTSTTEMATATNVSCSKLAPSDAESESPKSARWSSSKLSDKHGSDSCGSIKATTTRTVR